MATLSRNLKLQVNLKNEKNQKYRLTHIVCTIGPKTKEIDMLNKLFDAGMNIVRLNFSHGTYEVIYFIFIFLIIKYHGEVIDNVRKVLKTRGPDARCAIMLDTKGPEIRTGKLKEKQIKLIAEKVK